MCEIVHEIGGDESSEANRGKFSLNMEKQSLESRSNGQERAIPVKGPGRHSLDNGAKSPALSWGKYGPHRYWGT